MDEIKPADPLAAFAERNRETSDRIGLVLDRRQHTSPYRSYSEWLWDLADAYDERARFWQDAMNAYPQADVVYSAVLDARGRCRDEARNCRRRRSVRPRENTEAAWRTYAPNLRGWRETAPPGVAACGQCARRSRRAPRPRPKWTNSGQRCHAA